MSRRPGEGPGSPCAAHTAGALIVLVASVLVAGCSGGDAATTTTTTVPTSTTTADGGPDTTAGKAAGAPDLAGTAWQLAAIVEGGDGTLITGSPVPAVVTFAERTIDVYDGVNTASGEYSVDGAEVSIEMSSVSEFPYPPDSLPQYQLIRRLSGAGAMRLEGEQLVVSGSDGSQMFLDPAGAGVAGG